MTFVVGKDRIIDQSIPEFARVLSHLLTMNDFDRMWELRLQLVEVQEDMASELTDSEHRIRRIRGEQWKLTAELRTKHGNDKIDHLFLEFWRGGTYCS